MGEWKERSLGDLLRIKHGYAFAGEHIVTNDNGKVLVTPGNFAIGGGWKPSYKKFYKGDFPDEYILNEGDLVVTMTDLSKDVDTLGYSARVPRDERLTFLHNQRIGLVTEVTDEADPDFLYWVMRTTEYRSAIVNTASGSTVSHTSPSRIYEYAFDCPDLPEQRAIASVLSSLDAKIDLLHRQNKTLEAMAEALFRQWFVERCPEFAEGEAEEGWEEYVLTDIASHWKDSVNPGKHPTRIYHHYSLPAYDEGRKPSPELGDTIKSSKYVVPENAVLISKLNPRFPRVWPVRDKKHEHPISSTEFQVFVPKKDEMFGFLYCFLSSKPVQDELASAASGTSGSHQRVSPDDIKALTFQAKSKQQLVDFSKVVDPLLEKIDTNKDQVANLTKLRDTLLPKLMSGEVRVEMQVLSTR